jgi:hypothetical protein
MTAQNNWPSTPFNSGYAFQIDSDTHPTPTQIRVLQSSSLSMKSSNKELFGQNIFPVAVGRAQIKVTGKIKFAESSPRLVRDFVGGANNSLMSAGQTLVANNEAQSVPGSSTYTITVNNAATFATDLGVVYQATGEPLTNVASVAAAGQYSVNTTTGVYTFYSGDASASLYISYAYTLASVGDTITLSNTAAGAANAFQMMMGATFQNLQTNIQLYECVPESLNLWDTKIGDFNMPEEEFSCFVNAAGNLGIISMPVLG